MNTHRDDVNPDEDLDRAVQGDSTTDFADSTVGSFVQVLVVLLRHFIQAESPLRAHAGALLHQRRESAATSRQRFELKNRTHLELADEPLLCRPVLFS